MRLLPALALASLALTDLAHASLPAMLRLKGQHAGDIKGGVTSKGREGAIAVLAVDHSIVSPRDPQSGLATGPRQHKPFVLRKEVDSASTALWNALVTNENLTSATLDFYQPNLAGTAGLASEVNHFTIKLTNASVASIRLVKANVRDPNLATQPDYEEVTLTYQKIEWIFRKTGATATDTWGAAKP